MAFQQIALLLPPPAILWRKNWVKHNHVTEKIFLIDTLAALRFIWKIKELFIEILDIASWIEELVFACQTKEVFIFIFSAELSIPFLSELSCLDSLAMTNLIRWFLNAWIE